MSAHVVWCPLLAVQLWLSVPEKTFDSQIRSGILSTIPLRTPECVVGSLASEAHLSTSQILQALAKFGGVCFSSRFMNELATGSLAESQHQADPFIEEGTWPCPDFLKLLKDS